MYASVFRAPQIEMPSEPVVYLLASGQFEETVTGARLEYAYKARREPSRSQPPAATRRAKAQSMFCCSEKRAGAAAQAYVAVCGRCAATAGARRFCTQKPRHDCYSVHVCCVSVGARCHIVAARQREAL